MDIKETFRLALNHYQDGNFQQAENICKEILNVQIDNADALHLLGIIYYQLDDYDSAIEYIKKALQFSPAEADAYYNLGNALEAKGQIDEAITCYQKALEFDTNFAEAYNNLGHCFYDRGQLDDAITCYQKALRLNPKYPEAYNNLGYALHDKGQLDEAITCYQKALELDPNFAEAYTNMGLVFQDKGQLDEAISCYQKALQIDPDFAEAYNNLGHCFYLQQGHVDEAMTYFQKALQVNPNSAEAHWNMSLALLLQGNFKQGWKEYEWRWKLKRFRQRNFSQPLWEGSDIAGRTILLHAEQGLGDTIQFIRYAPMVAQHGAKVIVECQRELMSLLKYTDGVQEVIAYGDPLPDFDVHCPLLSLPLVFGTTLDSIPAKIPYITVDPASGKKWKDKVLHDDSKLKIGLAWAGSAKEEKLRHRSCPLDMFYPLARLDNTTFYSLQKGDASKQVKNPPEGMKLIDYTEEINDFSDTAAFIENLDLIISVDTAVAHLAGALGRPIWTLLPFAVDSRWLLNREDSPWYPTMRLFRQSSPGDWETIIASLLNNLQKYRSYTG